MSRRRRSGNAILRGLVGLRTDGGAREVGSDPVEVRELRPDCHVAATVLGADGESLAFFPNYVGWPFADALRAEAERNGIQVRRGRGTTDHPA